MTNATTAGSAWKHWAAAMLCIAAVLGFLFRQSFESDKVLFSNDAPLGLISSQAGVTASTFDGIVGGFWNDLNWIGIEQPSVLPGLSWGMFQIFGSPVANAKFHAPFSFLYLGFSAWLLFRVLGFRQTVCVIGGLAAALNMNPFSHGTWGLPSRALTYGSALLAIAALYSGLKSRAWIKAALAGMCVGMGIMEGFDVGALYSLYVAAFGLFLGYANTPADEKADSMVKRLAKGGALVAVVAISAGLFSAQGLNMLVSTQIKGVEGMGQDTKAKQERWDEATAWSLPKTETLRVIVPGLFGYRMDSAGGGQYWGSVGFPAYQRHSGAGEYAGILVVMVGVWGSVNAFRRKDKIYTDLERKVVLFWTGAAIVSVLFAWGRWAPFYQILYKLPFFSTIRNPIKFMHFFHLSLLILFGFGLQSLFVQYIERASAKAGGMMEQFKKWWATAPGFERKVTVGFVVGLALSVVGFLMYSTSKQQLGVYLASVGFQDTSVAHAIIDFSVSEVGMYLLLYALALGVLVLCVSGYFSGPRARWAGWVIGAFIAIDMARANQPWIIYYNYKERYASNGVIDFLRKAPLEHRVTSRVGPFSGGAFLSKQTEYMQSVFGEWLQHLFQFYNIQSLDISQFPRRPELDSKYFKAFLPAEKELYQCARLWELSNTRYIIGQKEFLAQLNASFDPLHKRFQVATNFGFVPKPGVNPNGNLGLDDITWALKPDGNFAIFEFTGALPRYRLYTQWKQVKDDNAALAELREFDFDPSKTLLVNDDAVATVASSATNVGTVTVASYAPKKIQAKVEATGPSILLWNDRWSPNWKAFLDGQPANLLRVNFIMRGIQVPAGAHQIEMRYEQPARFLWVSFATMALGVAFCLFLSFDRPKKQ